MNTLEKAKQDAVNNYQSTMGNSIKELIVYQYLMDHLNNNDDDNLEATIATWKGEE